MHHGCVYSYTEKPPWGSHVLPLKYTSTSLNDWSACSSDSTTPYILIYIHVPFETCIREDMSFLDVSDNVRPCLRVNALGVHECRCACVYVGVCLCACVFAYVCVCVCEYVRLCTYFCFMAISWACAYVCWNLCSTGFKYQPWDINNSKLTWCHTHICMSCTLMLDCARLSLNKTVPGWCIFNISTVLPTLDGEIKKPLTRKYVI